MSKAENLQEEILDQNPTDEQKEAIFTEELEFLLRASPGSGKPGLLAGDSSGVE